MEKTAAHIDAAKMNFVDFFSIRYLPADKTIMYSQPAYITVRVKNMLIARDITKIYQTAEGENRVLDNLSFHGKEGEFCIVTGKSGCGKSTLLNVLSCLDSATSGQLEICGKVIDGSHRQICRIRREDIAFIFQGYNLISSLTAQENVELGLKYKKTPRAKRKLLAEKALYQVGMEHRRNYLPHQLSGGQQQRVAIARAIVLRPKILFCDEPTGNLDAASAKLVLDKILELKNSGTLVLMITHDLSLLPLADRVFALEKGRLVAVE